MNNFNTGLFFLFMKLILRIVKMNSNTMLSYPKRLSQSFASSCIGSISIILE